MFLLKVPTTSVLYSTSKATLLLGKPAATYISEGEFNLESFLWREFWQLDFKIFTLWSYPQMSKDIVIGIYFDITFTKQLKCSSVEVWIYLL